jgi:hypothetical protein
VEILPMPVKISTDEQNENGLVKFPPLGKTELRKMVVNRMNNVIDCQYFKKILAKTEGIMLYVIYVKNNDMIFSRSISVSLENYDNRVHLLNEILGCVEENLKICETGNDNRPVALKSLRGLLFIVVGAEREIGLSLIDTIGIGIGLITEEKVLS